MEKFIEVTLVAGENDEIKEKTLLSVSNIVRVYELDGKCYICSRLFIKSGKCKDCSEPVLESFSEIMQKLKT